MAHVLKRDVGMGTEEGGTDLIYLAMGLCCGLFFLVLMSIVFGLPRFFLQTRLPAWSVPACGGLIVGLIGLLSPQALGLGYTTINQVLTGELTFTLAASLVVFKILTTGFSLGSGMSGGIFAPSLFLGAMVGAVFWPRGPVLLAVNARQYRLFQPHRHGGDGQRNDPGTDNGHHDYL